MAAFRTRIYAVKLLLLDHGELVTAMGLDDELVQKNSAPGENIDSEISRQSAILKQYEDKYSKVRPRRCLDSTTLLMHELLGRGIGRGVLLTVVVGTRVVCACGCDLHPPRLLVGHCDSRPLDPSAFISARRELRS